MAPRPGDDAGRPGAELARALATMAVGRRIGAAA
jgi:hypothetical protein